MDAVDLAKVPQQIIEVAERAQKAGWDTEWLLSQGKHGPVLCISIPTGRDKRKLIVRLERAQELVAVPFEKYRLLDGYLAIYESDEAYIEALLRNTYSIYDLPGIEIIDEVEKIPMANEEADAGDEVIESEPTKRASIREGAPWRLKIDDDRHPWSIEFSPASDPFMALVREAQMPVGDRRPAPRRPTLKIRGISASRHDETVQRLEEVGGAVLFDLDLCYQIRLELSRYSGRRTVRDRARPWALTRPPSFPKLRYPVEALSFYSYGRSAAGMPLLQFLSYYQVLEFFFPMHFHQHLLKKLRQELTDPRFDVTDDTDLARLLNAMSSGRGGYGNERDQLKATMNGCVDEATFRDFLQTHCEGVETLGDKKAIKGVPLIIDDGHHGDLLNQAAERIYAIRCRIVHAKADGGDRAAELLLPSSSEVQALTADIDVLQYLAQKVIVAGGTPLA
jgi:hypothetical protein